MEKFLKLMESHNQKVAEIERIEKELREVGQKMVETAKILDFNELIEKYPDILDSAHKFDIFVYLKNRIGR